MPQVPVSMRAAVNTAPPSRYSESLAVGDRLVLVLVVDDADDWAEGDHDRLVGRVVAPSWRPISM